MDDWLEQMTQALDRLATETEEWVEATVTTVVAVSDEIANELEANLSPILKPLQADLERNLDQLADTVEHTVEPWIDGAMVNLGTWVEQAVTPVNQVVDPWLQQRPHCIGCRNYHGQTYGDEVLICAIHPFGPEADRESCPDYDAVWDDISG